jgi:hypothetical protein
MRVPPLGRIPRGDPLPIGLLETQWPNMSAIGVKVDLHNTLVDVCF